MGVTRGAESSMRVMSDGEMEQGLRGKASERRREI